MALLVIHHLGQLVGRTKAMALVRALDELLVILELEGAEEGGWVQEQLVGRGLNLGALKDLGLGVTVRVSVGVGARAGEGGGRCIST